MESSCIIRAYACIICALLLSLCLAAEAQSLNWIQATRGGPFTRQQALDVASDAEGNVYMTGIYGSSNTSIVFAPGQSLPNPDGNAKMFLAKYDQAGSLQWVLGGGIGALGARGRTVSADQAGFVYVSGFFSGTGNFGTPYIGSGSLTSNGSDDIFLAKYTSSGQLVWIKNFGGSSADFCEDLLTDISGNIYLAGISFSSSLMIGSIPLSPDGPGDGLLIKFDSSGTASWAQCIGGDGEDWVNAIHADSSDHLYIGGSVRGTGTIGNHIYTAANADLFIAKVSSSGSFIWATSGGGTGNERITDIRQSKGSLYTTAGFYAGNFSFQSASFNNSGNSDGLLMKFDTSGILNWAQAFGGPGDDIYYTLDVKDSLIYTGGMITGNVQMSPSINLTATGWDALIACYDSSGSLIKARCFGGGDYDVIRSVSAGPKQMYAGGILYGSFMLDADSFSAGGTYEAFVASFDSLPDHGQPTLIKEAATQEVALTIYPNPAKDFFCLKSSVALSNVELKIFNSMGAEQQQFHFEKLLQAQIPLNSYAPGLYFIQLATKDQIKMLKIVLQ